MKITHHKYGSLCFPKCSWVVRIEVCGLCVYILSLRWRTTSPPSAFPTGNVAGVGPFSQTPGSTAQRHNGVHVLHLHTGSSSWAFSPSQISEPSTERLEDANLISRNLMSRFLEMTGAERQEENFMSGPFQLQTQSTWRSAEWWPISESVHIEDTDVFQQ